MVLQIIATLFEKLQYDKTLTQEEIIKRTNMIFDWQKNYGKVLEKLNRKIHGSITKNKSPDFFLILKQIGVFHKLKLAYQGVEYYSIIEKLKGASPETVTETINKELNDDKAFIKNLFIEMRKNDIV